MNRRNYVIVFFILLGLGAVYAWTVYNAGPRDLNREKSDLSIDANQLLLQFQEDEPKANSKYLDKIIEVEGVIASIDKSETKNITLETEDMLSAIVCEMTDTFDGTGLSQGSRVKIKGQCTGFLADVILVKCVIENE